MGASLSSTSPSAPPREAQGLLCIGTPPVFCMGICFFFDKAEQIQGRAEDVGTNSRGMELQRGKARRGIPSNISPTVQQLRSFHRFTHMFRNNYQQSLTTAQEQRKKTRQLLRPPARGNSTSGCACEAEGRGGGGSTESTHTGPQGRL